MAVLAVLLLVCWRPGFSDQFFCALEASFRKGAASRTLVACCFLAPVAIRLCLLPAYPAPVPVVQDEFGHLLVADTLLHSRLANPPHRLPQSFETNYVLQRPTYSAVYPLGQGFMYAVGRKVFGTPWAGVFLSTCLMCGSVYWMLLGWVNRRWALWGLILLICHLAVFSSWMNGYWGGALMAATGALAFGALPRFTRSHSPQWALLLGAALAASVLVRPFESLAMAASVVVVLGIHLAQQAQPARLIWQTTALILAGACPAISLTLIHNVRVTGHAMQLPYQLAQWQYGVPQSFSLQKPNVPHYALNPEQQGIYWWQTVPHNRIYEHFPFWLTALGSKTFSVLSFFYGPALLILALAALGSIVQKWQLRWATWFLLVMLLCLGSYSMYFPHYVAAWTGILFLLVIFGAQRAIQWQWREQPAGRTLVRGLSFVVVMHFGFTFLCNATHPFLPATLQQYSELWRLPLSKVRYRAEFDQTLKKISGDHLVFVRYGPSHSVHDDWVFNGADVSRSSVVWAKELDTTGNCRLAKAVPFRTLWLAEADIEPPRLTRYAIPSCDLFLLSKHEP